MQTTTPIPMRTVPGFLPALMNARRRRPHVSMGTWRRIASMLAAPGQLDVSSSQICKLADDMKRAQGAA